MIPSRPENLGEIGWGSCISGVVFHVSAAEDLLRIGVGSVASLSALVNEVLAEGDRVDIGFGATRVVAGANALFILEVISVMSSPCSITAQAFPIQSICSCSRRYRSPLKDFCTILRAIIPNLRRCGVFSYIRCVMRAMSAGPGLNGSTGTGSPGPSSAYALHLPIIARRLICARARDCASLGATTSLYRALSSGSVRTRSEAPTSVQTTGTPVKAASPSASGRPSEIEELRNSHLRNG